MSEETSSSEVKTLKKDKKITLTLSWKLLSIILALLLVGLTIYTKPWETPISNARTIKIDGEVSIKRVPDSFIFNPSFEADSQQAINDKTNEVVAKVKELGLGDAGIQTQISSYENYGMDGPDGTFNHTLYLTLSVEDKDLAQKIQDYLASAGAVGSISPTVGFTRATQKALKDEATAKAVEDAKKRGESTAQNLGVKLGRVITVNEPENMDVYPIAAYDSSFAEGSSKSSLPINAGESEYNYKIEVEFEIR
ncbi:SIMPL domain-containing protein [Candidatus Saccharibacteria bacterium]|nr:SIMPL domain-containing protein [Candidatus Saccharibacteria bacterium]